MSLIKVIYKNIRYLFYIYLIIISFIAFYPKNAGVDIGGDKTNHLLAFLVFAILHYLSFKKSYLKIFVSGLIFGLYIEFVQYFLPYRCSDVLDVMVDIIGLMIGIGFIFLFNKLTIKENL